MKPTDLTAFLLTLVQFEQVEASPQFRFEEGYLLGEITFHPHDGNAVVPPDPIARLSIRPHQFEVSYAIRPMYEASAYAKTEGGGYYSFISTRVDERVKADSVDWNGVRRDLTREAQTVLADKGAPELLEIELDEIVVYEVGPGSTDTEERTPPGQ